MQKNYRSTIYACFTGYTVQAIIINFLPLLFLWFHNTWNISMQKITLLVTFSFILQLIIDAASVFFVDRIGYRPLTVLANVLSVIGIASMTFLPELTGDPFVGLLISSAISALGSGLLEVLISPIVDRSPTDNKEKAMSLLHSFYCWGYLAVVLITTLFFALFGIENWRILALIWALVPLADAIAFTRVPIAPYFKDGEKGMSLTQLVKNKLFWLMMLAMLCAGACEHGVCQWASAFAESALGVSKTIGDLAGPSFFALMMGIARVIYGKFGERIPLKKFMLLSASMCVFAYLLIALSPWPVLGFIGCGVCGFSVGIFWPGTLSMSASALPQGGNIMFCLLALAGDMGCSAGPTVAGFVSGALGDNLKMGILAAIVFPLLLLSTLIFRKKDA